MVNSKRIVSLGLMLTLLALTGCASKAKLHNLSTGEVIPVKLDYCGIWEGNIHAELPEGQKVVGAHTPLSKDIPELASMRSQKTSGSKANTKYGYAVLLIEGRTIKVIYAIEPEVSYGFGTDNNGNKYSLVF
jgi:hypothetical protein